MKYFNSQLISKLRSQQQYIWPKVTLQKERALYEEILQYYGDRQSPKAKLLYLRNNVLQVSKNNDEESNLLLKSPMCSILSLDQIEHTNYHGKPRSPGDCW